jgi:hypothetical protein
MAKPFEVVRERLLITAGDSGPPVIHHDKCRPNGQFALIFGAATKQWSRQAPLNTAAIL